MSYHNTHHHHHHHHQNHHHQISSSHHRRSPPPIYHNSHSHSQSSNNSHSNRDRERDRERDRDRDRERARDRDRERDRERERERDRNQRHDEFNEAERDRFAGEYTSICLKNLNESVSDSQMRDSIYNEFRRFGDFSIKIATNKSGRDDRIAFVNFSRHEEAREAKRSKQNAPLHGVPLYIEPVFRHRPNRRNRTRSRSPPHPPPPPPPPPIAVKRRSRSRTRSRSRSRDAKTTRPPPIYTQHHHHQYPDYREHVQPEFDKDATRTLFIGNLDPEVDAEKLRRTFDRFGYIEEIDIKRGASGTTAASNSSSSANSKAAFAFIKYNNLDMAFNAKVAMSGKLIGSYECKIGYGKITPTECLWMSGLNSSVRRRDLQKDCERYGRVADLDWTPGDQYAYVLFETLEDAKEARENLRGKPITGSTALLRIDYADPSRFASSAKRLRRRTSPTTNSSAQITPPYHKNRRRSSSRSRHSININNHGRSFERRERVNSGSVASERRVSKDTDHSPVPQSSRSKSISRSRSHTRSRSCSPRSDSFADNSRTLNGDESRMEPDVDDEIEEGQCNDADDACKDAESLNSLDKHIETPLNGNYSNGDDNNNNIEIESPKVEVHMDEHDSNDTKETCDEVRDEESGADEKKIVDEAGEQLQQAPNNNACVSFNSSDNDIDNGNDMLIRESLVNKELQLYESPICSIHDVKKVLKHTWNGVFTLKKITFPTRFYLLAGNRNLTEEFLPKCLDQNGCESSSACLKITQRLRLDPLKVEELEKKLYDSNYLSTPFYKKTNVDNCQFSVLLSLPHERSGKDGAEQAANVALQHRSLHNLILYLNQKCAAGVIPLPDDDMPTAMVHAFPPNCQFSNKLLRQLLPQLHQIGSASTNDYLIIVLLKN